MKLSSSPVKISRRDASQLWISRATVIIRSSIAQLWVACDQVSTFQRPCSSDYKRIETGCADSGEWCDSSGSEENENTLDRTLWQACVCKAQVCLIENKGFVWMHFMQTWDTVEPIHWLIFWSWWPSFLKGFFSWGFLPPCRSSLHVATQMLFLHSNSMSKILGARMSDRKSSGESKTQHLEVKTCHGRYMHFFTSLVCCSLEAKVLLYFREIFSGDLRVWSHFHAEGCCWCKCPRGCNSRLGGEIWAF